MKQTLMEYAVADARYGRGFDEPFLRQLFGEPELTDCLLGAAHFANGEIDAAVSRFSAAIAANPSAFNYLCLSRCESVGRTNDIAAIEILKKALDAHPTDHPLRLSLAGAYYRRGETAAANAELGRGGPGMTAWIREADPGIGAVDAELRRAIRDGSLERVGENVTKGYTEEAVQSYWEMLWYHMATAGVLQHGWSNLSAMCQRIIGNVVNDAPSPVRSVVNFGVFCGYPDAELAKRFPSVAFTGVDIQARTKALNDAAFQSENLEFIAGNIVDVLSSMDLKGQNALLFHSRTTTLLYPEMVKKVYRAAHNAGVAYIATWENNSLSVSTCRFHDFGEIPDSSVPYSSVMLIHDYQQLLEACGFRVEKVEKLPSTRQLLEYPQSLADCHVALVAKRI
ncbi:MAG: hypothetical protein M3Z17_02285 [Gemmatimonadota bacterium]|nr:hypothetical protein [Gemmatimonadota bacterium]